MKRLLIASCFAAALAASTTGRLEAQQPRPTWVPSGQPTCNEWFENGRQGAMRDLEVCLIQTSSNTMELSRCAATFSAQMSILIGAHTMCLLGY